MGALKEMPFLSNKSQKIFYKISITMLFTLIFQYFNIVEFHQQYPMGQQYFLDPTMGVFQKL